MVVNSGSLLFTSSGGPPALTRKDSLAEDVTGITQLQIGSDKVRGLIWKHLISDWDINYVTLCKLYIRYNFQEMLTALSELSKFPNHSSFTPDPRTRRPHHQPDLRSMIESQQIASYKKFLESFKEIRDGVKGLEVELSSLHEICSGMSSNLAASKQNSRNLIDEIAKLGSEKKKLMKERDLAVAYQNAFQLNAEDLKTLRGTELASNQSLTPEFFAVRFSKRFLSRGMYYFVIL